MCHIQTSNISSLLLSLLLMCDDINKRLSKLSKGFKNTGYGKRRKRSLEKMYKWFEINCSFVKKISYKWHIGQFGLRTECLVHKSPRNPGFRGTSLAHGWAGDHLPHVTFGRWHSRKDSHWLGHTFNFQAVELACPAHWCCGFHPQSNHTLAQLGTNCPQGWLWMLTCLC